MEVEEIPPGRRYALCSKLGCGAPASHKLVLLNNEAYLCDKHIEDESKDKEDVVAPVLHIIKEEQ